MLTPVIGGHCLTEHFPGRANVLTSMIGVTSGFDSKLCPVGYPLTLKKSEFTGIWDTGASMSAITQSVIDALGLVQTGVCQIHGVHGPEMTPTFNVAFHLSSGVIFTSITASRGKLHGADILVGMDVIGAGDFAVTNHKGCTTISLRIPSQECIDFLARAKHQKELNPHSLPPPPPPKPPTKFAGTPRNAPCPCGSGKKFKLCCDGKPVVPPVV
ncbi:MAG TPA: SEC-C metal-binding domain-containing protein [Opitutaceae bacterium]|jgi:hypothetical protein|nr:SEC-C metal-binding domain-containing protein [Opitutaceae bacterium]